MAEQIPITDQLAAEKIFTEEEISPAIERAIAAFATNRLDAIVAHRNWINTMLARHSGGQDVPPTWLPRDRVYHSPWSGAYPPSVPYGSVPYRGSSGVLSWWMPDGNTCNSAGQVDSTNAFLSSSGIPVPGKREALLAKAQHEKICLWYADLL